MQEDMQLKIENIKKQQLLNIEKKNNNENSFGYCKKCKKTYLVGTCNRCKILKFLDKIVGFLFIGIVILVILFLLVKGCSSVNDSEPTQEELEQQIIREECSSRSNTYYKCSYSVWEGMCTCEER